jgi:large subunit ribosomal protein L29
MKWVVTQMKATEMLGLSSEELTSRIDQLKSELFNLRFQLATGQLENPMRIRQVRKDIARAKTVLRQRELGIS